MAAAAWPAWRMWLGGALVAFAVGCSPKIGDNCTVSTDCSATGDRLCDITEPGGYCTVFNCEPDSCPDEAACINFGTRLSVGLIPGCTVSQGDSPYQRSFCLASCTSDSDCRGGYKCLEPEKVGGVKVDYNRSNPVCVVPRTGATPGETGAPSYENEVCLGSDAGAATGGSAEAGSSGGNMSVADNAGAGGSAP